MGIVASETAEPNIRRRRGCDLIPRFRTAAFAMRECVHRPRSQSLQSRYRRTLALVGPIGPGAGLWSRRPWVFGDLMSLVTQGPGGGPWTRPNLM